MLLSHAQDQVTMKLKVALENVAVTFIRSTYVQIRFQRCQSPGQFGFTQLVKGGYFVLKLFAKRFS